MFEWSVRHGVHKNHSNGQHLLNYKNNAWILGFLAQSNTVAVSLPTVVCFCGFVSPARPVNDCLHHVQTVTYIRLIHGPLTALEVVNNSISGADTFGLRLCYCSAFWPSDRRGGGMFGERRDEMFYKPALHTP